jgi:hypothetical protein
LFKRTLEQFVTQEVAPLLVYLGIPAIPFTGLRDGATMDAGNWIALLLGLGALTINALNAYAQWPGRSEDGKRAPNHSVLLIALLSSVVLGAVGYDIYDRRHQVHRENVLSWGAAGDNYHMAVATHDVQAAANHRLMLIIRPNLMGTDPMTDTNIAKSGLFTIAGPVVVLALPTATPLRMAINQVNLMDFDAILLPIGIGPERIRSLADVVDLGGSIFQTRATSVMAGAPIDPSNQSAQAK